MKFYAFFALVLCGLVGCGPGNSGVIRHLFGTAAPVQFKVGYVAGNGVPPLMFGGSVGYGWGPDEKVAVSNFVCNNLQALLPGKDCYYPNTLDEMTPIAATPTADGYDDTAIFAAADLVPGDDGSTLKVVFLDGVYTPRTSATCSDASCHFGYTVKKPGHAEVSAVFLPEIRQFVNSRFGGSTSGVGQDMFGYLISATIIHEVGHQLGLVDGETSAVTNHEDPNGTPHHCANPKCIMHATGPGITWWEWSKNRKTLGAAAGDLLFDSDCQTDIRRAITY